MSLSKSCSVVAAILGATLLANACDLSSSSDSGDLGEPGNGDSETVVMPTEMASPQVDASTPDATSTAGTTSSDGTPIMPAAGEGSAGEVDAPPGVAAVEEGMPSAAEQDETAQEAMGMWFDVAGPIAARPSGITGRITATDINTLMFDLADEGRYLGVVEVDLVGGTMTRFLQGRSARRYAQDRTVYIQSCGGGTNRVAMADSAGLSTALTPCSGELSNPGFSPTRFGMAPALSPDEEYIAADYLYFDDGWRGGTVVLDRAGEIQADFVNRFDPIWTADGQLIVGSGAAANTFGVHRGSEVSGWSLERFDAGQLNGHVGSIAVHPRHARIAFVYNSIIWEMDLDGKNLRRVVDAPGYLSDPTYSPDGRFLAYLQYIDGDKPEKALYFTDLEDGDANYAYSTAHLWTEPTFRALVGPLSWTYAE